jgi:phosphopantothenoylcysteine decarboxylase / phosphopantothenate---cysteine ligase
MRGMQILVTAGPTQEPIDPVRFIGNRSSGKMGYAVARAARLGGHAVTLISGPVALPPPDCACVMVTTADEMCAAVLRALPACDALVMAAAVADWRPRHAAPRKLKKENMAPCLELERTPDILLAVRHARRAHQIVVGFAAETGDPLAEAQRKLVDKGLDMIAANDVSAPGSGFGGDTNRVTLITPAAREALPLLTKDAVATLLIARIEAIFERKAREIGAAG